MEPKSILIVEDEQISAMDLKETLVSLGYRVTGIASSGERAIEMADAETPDLILMDIQLSGKLSGIEAAEQILRHHAIPIIYLTAYADPLLVERAKRTKPYGYLLKPSDERSIRTEIEIALYKSGLDRDFQREYKNLEHRVIERTEELTRMNASLKKSETRYRLLFERSREGIFILNADGDDQGRIVEVNESGAAMHGYSPGELLKMKITDLDIKENPASALFRFDAILRGEWIGGEINHVRKDKSVFPLDFQAGLLELDGRSYVFSVMRDISEQKQVRDEITRARDEWEHTFDAVTDMIAIIDTDFRIVRVNKAMADRLGVLPEQAVGLCCYTAVHHTSCPPDSCPHRLLLSDGRPHTIDIHEDSLNGDFILSVAPIFDPSGTVSGSVHVLHDITERKRAENRLTLESRITSIIPEGILLIRVSDGEILYANPKSGQMFGYVSTDLVGKKISALNAPAEGRNPEEIAREIFDQMKRSGEWSGDILARRSDGTTFWSHASVSSFGHPELGPVWISVYTDITQRKLTEQALALASRKLNLMASITRHDILNQLMALNGYIELTREATTDPVIKAYLQKEAAISATIEHQILFTRDYQDMGIQAPEWLDLRGNVYRAVAAHNPGTITVDVNIPEIKVFADLLFEKVFFNLLDNALKYGGGGMKNIRISAREGEKGLVIVWEDDGIGISADDKPHLFTRGFGKHTGLGLFLSREVLSITRITITETGTPGKGARFEILVPKGGYRIQKSVHEG